MSGAGTAEEEVGDQRWGCAQRGSWMGDRANEPSLSSEQQTEKWGLVDARRGRGEEGRRGRSRAVLFQRASVALQHQQLASPTQRSKGIGTG